MPYQLLSLDSLVVNPANDRHGELENETAAIARLFSMREAHMRKLTKDLLDIGEVLEPPLVFPKNGKFFVADGNRRTTCLKLLNDPKKAPTLELQQFFAEQREAWQGKVPSEIECRVEEEKERIDDILFRRHTGSQGGVGQSNWDDRMKSNFVIRTGRNSGINVADEVERCLSGANLSPQKKIPRSNMNRLLSSEAIRNRIGFSVRRGKFEYIRNEEKVQKALSRIANDLSSGDLTLNEIWDTDTKIAYIDKLEHEGVLPSVKDKPGSFSTSSTKTPSKQSTTAPIKQTKQPTLIPHTEHGVIWSGHLQRHRAIWDELQFKLDKSTHPNAISVLLRVLLELSVENYISKSRMSNIHEKEKLSNKISKVAENMYAKERIDNKYLSGLRKMQNSDSIFSTDTLNRYIHSPQFAPSPEHLNMLWNFLSNFIVLCLNEREEANLTT